ncbi:MAG: hypothetical protein HYT03_00515 [Candidatus Harrisonbacteria bacterium]|nr:hypothetical protein [Candidatus Harrisonbacteria bacterium]
MSLELLASIGFFIDTLGKLLVGYMAIAVHYRFWREHKIDDKVFSQMKREQKFGLFGLLLIAIGFALQLPVKF